jgi:D-glycero-D-manno-heptose 1,7-bisphosphate phosphatase
MTLRDLNIDKTWTLFLDRDGVINRKIENDYVKNWVEFEFLEHTLPALRLLNSVFGRIVIVTNQQGIGKRVHRTEDLELIHKNMLYEIAFHGGRVDQVYFSPHLATENHPNRKPGIGMALQARKEFPEIDFNRSLVVGDSKSDMEFGRAAGMHTVLLTENQSKDPLADFTFRDLYHFAEAFQ